MPSRSGFGTVLMAGRSAWRISTSGFARVLANRQKATSSQIAATIVKPRTARKHAVWTRIVTRFRR